MADAVFRKPAQPKHGTENIPVKLPQAEALEQFEIRADQRTVYSKGFRFEVPKGTRVDIRYSYEPRPGVKASGELAKFPSGEGASAVWQKQVGRVDYRAGAGTDSYTLGLFKGFNGQATVRIGDKTFVIDGRDGVAKPVEAKPVERQSQPQLVPTKHETPRPAPEKPVTTAPKPEPIKFEPYSVNTSQTGVYSAAARMNLPGGTKLEVWSERIGPDGKTVTTSLGEIQPGPAERRDGVGYIGLKRGSDGRDRATFGITKGSGVSGLVIRAGGEEFRLDVPVAAQPAEKLVPGVPRVIGPVPAGPAPVTLPKVEGAPLAVTQTFEFKTIDLPKHRAPTAANFGNEFEVLSSLTDVSEHNPDGPWYQRGSSPATTVHETAHGVNSHVGNHYGLQPEYRNPRLLPDGWTMNAVQGVYFGKGKAAVVKDPDGIALSHVAANVPKPLRGSYYEQYLAQNGRNHLTSNHLATYVLDEGSAYVHTGIAMKEYEAYFAKQQTRTKPGQTSFVRESKGAGEFIGFMLSLAETIDRTPKAYRNEADKAQILGVIKHLVEESAGYYNYSLEHYPDTNRVGRTHLQTLSTSQDAGVKRLRDFANRTYGEGWVEGLLKRQPR